MAFWRAFVWFIILLLIFMAVSEPFVQSVRPFSQEAKTMSEDTATLKYERSIKASRNGVEDSAREVPTGPDPLHHHNNPTGP